MIFHRRRRRPVGARVKRNAGALVGKELSLDDLGGYVFDGMTIGVGGWGLQRKPMALVRRLLQSGVRDLTLVTFGGPEVSMFCASGTVRRVVQGVVAADTLLLDPDVHTAHQDGTTEVVGLDRRVLQLALQAAAMRLPFVPVCADEMQGAVIGCSDIETIRSPYGNGEPLLAVPAIGLDVALVHVDRADYAGNTESHGDDAYFDDLLAGAARQCFASCDELVGALTQANLPEVWQNVIEPSHVSAVIHAPFRSMIANAERTRPFVSAN